MKQDDSKDVNACHLFKISDDIDDGATNNFNLQFTFKLLSQNQNMN